MWTDEHGLRRGDSDYHPTTVLLAVLDASWDQIDPLRTYLEAYVTQRLDVVHAERISVVSHELLENAVKYGTVGTSVQFDLRLAKLGERFLVRVTNGAVSSRVRLLEEEMRRIRRSPGREAYVEALERARKLPEGKSMIGLARAGYEGDVALRVIARDGTVIVEASSR